MKRAFAVVLALTSPLAAAQNTETGFLNRSVSVDVVVRIDEAAARPGAPREIRGAPNWAKGAIAFSRQLAGAVQPMLVNGEVGLVLATEPR